MTIIISSAHAYFGAPVYEKEEIVPDWQPYTASGIEITPDHQFVWLSPYDLRKCSVLLQPTPINYLIRLIDALFGANFVWGNRKEYKKKTRVRLKKVLSVTFDDGWDDCTYSFKIKT